LPVVHARSRFLFLPLRIPHHPRSALFPYTTLFRSSALPTTFGAIFTAEGLPSLFSDLSRLPVVLITIFAFSMSDTFDTLGTFLRSEEHTSELQSRFDLVCRLLLEKKNLYYFSLYCL